MCGRFTIAGHGIEAKRARLEVRRRFGIDDPDPSLLDQPEMGRYNVAPRQRIPVIRQASGGRRLELARWGLLPVWAKSSKDRLQPINARDDKLGGRMWKRLVDDRSHRVLIPADGWFEWVKAEDPKQKPAPFYHRVDGGDWFSFAGLLNTTRVDDLDEPITTAALITTSANGPASRIHDRMPAILSGPEAEEAWLSLDQGDDAAALIGPLADDRVSIAPASIRVNAVKNQGPGLLEEE